MTSDEIRTLKRASVVSIGFGVVAAIAVVINMPSAPNPFLGTVLGVVVAISTALMGVIFLGVLPILVIRTWGAIGDEVADRVSYLFDHGPKVLVMVGIGSIVLPLCLTLLALAIQWALPGCSSAATGELAFAKLSSCFIFSIDVSSSLSSALIAGYFGALLGAGYVFKPAMLCALLWFAIRKILHANAP